MGAETTYTIGELAQAADVTTRTVRYYVAQGLLPPPRGGGRAAIYGEEHLRRLELIRLLKQEYLPLNEIRALLNGLDDDAVRTLLSERRQPPPGPAPETAKEYAQALLHLDAESPRLLRRAAAAKAQSVSAQPRAAQARNSLFALRAPAAAGPLRPTREARRPLESPAVWQRYSLHPDVELHVRQPPTDATLGSRLEELVADIRRLILFPNHE